MNKKWRLIWLMSMVFWNSYSSSVFEKYSLEALQEQGRIKDGVDLSEGKFLEVLNEGQGQVLVPVLTLNPENIPKHPYALEGLVAGEGISKGAYLEMWSEFPDGSHFFTRTLDPKGPMGMLEGKFDWRVFQLPFSKGVDQKDPVALHLNVIFKGPGMVRLGQLKLVHYVPGSSATKAPGAWWSDRTAGWMGGIAGCVMGVLGALLGFLGRRPAARPVVVACLVLMVVMGLAGFCMGLVALFLSQPYGVFYVLLLGGGMASVLGATLLFTIRRQWVNDELRRMRALDTEPQ